MVQQCARPGITSEMREKKLSGGAAGSTPGSLQQRKTTRWTPMRQRNNWKIMFSGWGGGGGEKVWGCASGWDRGGEARSFILGLPTGRCRRLPRADYSWGKVSNTREHFWISLFFSLEGRWVRHKLNNKQVKDSINDSGATPRRRRAGECCQHVGVGKEQHLLRDLGRWKAGDGGVESTLLMVIYIWCW